MIIMYSLICQKLRAENANFLGYPSHADYILAIRMAKDKNTVREFLSDLNEKLQPICEADIKNLLKYKEEECRERKEAYDGKINMWFV